MSRGPGHVQQWLIGFLRNSDKPMTFVEISAHAYPEGEYEGDLIKALGLGKVGVVRSLRRALKDLVDKHGVIAIGDGGRGDPKRYWFNPMFFAMSGNKEDYDRATAVLENEPGGMAAAHKAAAGMFKPAQTA